ncbi:MAG: hypothetical protein AB7S38_05055 [Vulcanimicrobiota bacterium]
MKRLFTLLLLFLTLAPALADDVTGVWLSPDWFFPGTRRYNEATIRRVARDTCEELARQNITDIFLESFLRGYSIAPEIERDRTDARVIPYTGLDHGIPVYPHLWWNYKIEVNTVVDPLQIFIEEASLQGINVHAWVHAFYWKMDNTEVMYPWHNGPSLWNQLMADYLRTQADKLDGKPGAAPDTVALMRDAAGLFDTSSEGRELEQILANHGLQADGHPIGILLRQAMRAGAEPPDFLLYQTAEDPFPAPRGKRLRPIYVNPEHPEVRRQLTRVVKNLANNHPGLAGIHLDHIRFPVDGQGFPDRLGIEDGSYQYFESTNPQRLQNYQEIHQILARRRESLRQLVDIFREQLPAHMKLSAAVLPLYYRDRDMGTQYRLSGYDYVCQDWQHWKVDFVVPMMYEFHPYLIRNLVKLFETQMQQDPQARDIKVVPGVSRLQVARNGLGGGQSWVFFDLNLARDVKLEKEQTEDLNFEPE